MKKLIILAFLHCFVLSGWGQLQVKIGNDTIFCPENIEKGIQLAPHLSVTGGEPPYTYCWETRFRFYEDWGGWTYASEVLNDTTLSNPLITESVQIGAWYPDIEDWIKFKLTVTDSHGQSSQDSINIRFSRMAPQTLGEHVIFVTKGDSVLFDISDIELGGIHPYRSYSWSPAEEFSDPSSPRTWCKPTKDGYYYSCSIGDSMCCRYGISYLVFIEPPASIIPVDEANTIYQSGKTIYFNNETRQVVHLSFYNNSGKLIYQKTTQSDSYTPDFVESGQFLICRIEINQIQHTLKYITP